MSSNFTFHASSYLYILISSHSDLHLPFIYIIYYLHYTKFISNCVTIYTQLDWSVGTSYILGYDVRKVSFSLYIIFMHCQIFECVRLLEELNL